MHKNIFLSYATTYNYYYHYQQRCANSFIKFKNFNEIFLCNEKNIKQDYIDKHSNIFNKNEGTSQGIRGNFFIWKPYIIYRTLTEKMSDGDILMYADSTIEQIKPLDDIFELLKSRSILPLILDNDDNDERSQTKRDTFVLMGCDSEKYFKTVYNASHMFFKKDELTLKFVSEWKKFAEDERIITDMPNTQGLPDHVPLPNGHRHDQSIYSVLIKKYDLTGIHDLTQYGNPYRTKDEPWGQLLHHGR
jgi:hypothetical protein